MRSLLEGMKNITIYDEFVSIRSTLKEDSTAAMEALADALVK